MTVERERRRAAGTLHKWGEELLIAFALLTRLPLRNFDLQTNATIASAVWAYPVAGAVVGGSGAAAWYLSDYAGLSGLVSVLIALAAMTLVSGALHEDGLADFADGIGGGQTPEERLAIMRDSHIGTYGVVALIFALGLEVALLWEVSRLPSSPGVPLVLISLGAASRACVALPLMMLAPARSDGLGAAAQPATLSSAVCASAIAVMIIVLSLGVGTSIAALFGIVAGSVIVTAIAKVYIGGVTGDVCGAAIVTSFVSGLVCIVIWSAL